MSTHGPRRHVRRLLILQLVHRRTIRIFASATFCFTSMMVQWCGAGIATAATAAVSRFLSMCWMNVEKKRRRGSTRVRPKKRKKGKLTRHSVAPITRGKTLVINTCVACGRCQRGRQVRAVPGGEKDTAAAQVRRKVRRVRQEQDPMVSITSRSTIETLLGDEGTGLMGRDATQWQEVVARGSVVEAVENERESDLGACSGLALFGARSMLPSPSWPSIDRGRCRSLSSSRLLSWSSSVVVAVSIFVVVVVAVVRGRRCCCRCHCRHVDLWV